MNQDNIAAEIQRLRKENLSIRDIAKRLGLTKYRVETTLHQLRDARFNAILHAWATAGRTHRDQESQTASTSEQPNRNPGQPNEISNQPSENLCQPILKMESATAPDKHFLLDASVKNTQKVPALPKNAFIPGLYGFMCDYKRLMKQMHLSIKQKRCHWRHYIEGTLLKGVQTLQRWGLCLAQEQGMIYDELLLCGVLEACHDYLLLVLRTAPVVHTWMTMCSLQFLPNKALLGLLQEAQQAGFDAVEPGHGRTAA